MSEQPKKKTVNKIASTTAKAGGASAIALALNKIPGAETLYDIGNVFKSLSEGDVLKVASNTVGALIPGVSGKAIEAIAEDWLPKTPEIEKKKVKFNLSTSPADRQKYLKKYGPGYLNNPQFIKDQKLAYGTSSQGIMKKSMNPRKKYANGTSAVTANNYIVSPAEAMNDYNIMLAKAESEALQDPWLPIVATAGGLLQQGIGMAGNFAGGAGKVPTAPTAANGMNNVEEDVEVEGGEMFETPQGEVGEFKGPSHEQGGIPLEVGEDVEEGTKVYSDRLKVGKKTLAERKEAREKQIANLEKSAAEPLLDLATKNALKRKMEAIQKEEIADLQFQEQVNNIQAMADSMVKAFGTGAEGIKKMAAGGVVGEELDAFGNPIKKPVVDLASMLVTPGISGIGKPVNKTYSTVENLPSAPEYMKNLQQKPIDTFANNFGETLPNVSGVPKDYGVTTFLDSYDTDKADIQSDMDFYAPGQVGTPIVDPEGTVFSRTADKVGEKLSKVGETVGKEMSVPSTGDISKLIGNYLGMTAGMKNAAEQRSTDITHRNVYENVGKESQKLLDNAKKGIEISKAQAIQKANTIGRGSKKGARGSARGVNQMRAMDWLYDTALQGQIAEISANAANQISNIDVQKSGVAMNADQLKGTGEYQAAMANEAAKDAFYTAMGLGKKDFATGLQQTGKDLNAMKQNKIIANLMKDYGTYVTADEKGKVKGKVPVTPEEEIFTVDGIKYKKGKNNELIKVK